MHINTSARVQKSQEKKRESPETFQTVQQFDSKDVDPSVVLLGVLGQAVGSRGRVHVEAADLSVVLLGVLEQAVGSRGRVHVEAAVAELLVGD